jgi:hypothetical protein
MRRCWRTVVATTLVGLSCALVSCGSSSSRRTYTFDTSNVTTSSVGFPLEAVPTRRETIGIRLALADATLKPLLAKAKHRFVGSAPWDGIDDKPVGVELRFAFARPIAVDSDLPDAAIPPDAPAHGTCVTPYAASWIHLRAQKVTAISVLVDLRRERVADITTDARRGLVSPVPGRPYPNCHED